jgi:hypothetical protein
MHAIVVFAMLLQVTPQPAHEDAMFPSLEEVARLQNRRTDLVNELGGLQTQQAQKAELLKKRRSLDDAQAQLKEALRRNDKQTAAYLEDQIRYFNLANQWSDLNTAPILSTELDSLTKDIEAKTTELRNVELKLNRLTNIALVLQDFKTKISWAVALVVLVVYIAFMIIAYRDEVVRRRVFDAGSALQFLTLFLLIIAIILFGVTGILEGKELSALLGGLSGYILGRVSVTDRKKSEHPEDVSGTPDAPPPSPSGSRHVGGEKSPGAPSSGVGDANEPKPITQSPQQLGDDPATAAANDQGNIASSHQQEVG